MPKGIGQPKHEVPAPDDLAVLELKANLNSEQREHLEALKAKMKKILSGKTKQELAKAGDLVSLKNYKAILEEVLEFLQTKEIRQSELEKKFDLKKQYDEQFKTLKETGVIKELKDGQWGMVDILGQEQPIPSYKEIKARMETKAEMLDKKREQGFTQLLLVPIGMKLEDLASLAGKLILKKHQEGNLMATDGSTSTLDENQPVFINDGYKDADVNGSLVYGVKNFDKDNHGGQTKKELIEETGGWQIVLIEDLPDLPAENKGLEIGGRKQIESIKPRSLTPEEYLEKIQTEEQYEGEQFTTPEAQLTYFIQYLQQHDQVIDDSDGQGRICWNVGAYFKGTGFVPYGVWGRDDGRFYVNMKESDWCWGKFSARPSVII